MKGKFIVIEGNDGSGKGTQFELLVNYLKGQGKEVETIDLPQYGTKSAGPVEEYLNGKYGSVNEVSPQAASLLFAVDRFDAGFKVREAINQGKIVIANRYTLSNAAHQGAKIKNQQEKEEFFKWIDKLEYGILNLPKPDTTIFLHVPFAISYQLVLKKTEREHLNGKKQDIHESDINYLKAVEQTYIELAKKDDSIKTIECAPNNELLDIEEIKNKIINIIEKL